jgi:hypothetical protein
MNLDHAGVDRRQGCLSGLEDDVARDVVDASPRNGADKNLLRAVKRASHNMSYFRRLYHYVLFMYSALGSLYFASSLRRHVSIERRSSIISFAP